MSDSGSWLSSSIAALAAADHPQAIAVLARAFCDNPLNVAVIGAGDAEERLRSNFHGMRSLLPTAADRGDVLVARSEGRVTGVLISAPPGAYPLPPPPLLPRLRCLFSQGWRVAARWGEVFEALDQQHPPQPSWYLGTLGVDPICQGRGVGTALVKHWLARVDQERSAAYVETDVAANRHFYARAGFDPAGELFVLGTPVWRMWRPAVAGEISSAAPPQ